MIQAPVTTALHLDEVPDGEIVRIYVTGRIVGTEPGQVHLQVSDVACSPLRGGPCWTEWFTLGSEPLATIRDWVG